MTMMTSGIILSPLTPLRRKAMSFYSFMDAGRGKYTCFWHLLDPIALLLRDFALKSIGLTAFMDRKHVQTVVWLKNIVLRLRNG